MRTLFVAVSKVFGLLQVYIGLAYTTSLLPVLSMMGQPCSPDTTETTATTVCTNTGLAATGMAGTVVLTFVVAWVLMCRAEWLADRLQIPGGEGQPPITGDALLAVGARLLGIFAIVQAAPECVRALAEVRTGAFWWGRTIGTTLLPPAVKVALGLLLTLKTDMVLAWMAKDRLTEHQPGPDAQ